MTDTAKPPEIAFRDHEYKRLQEALETWEECPEQEQRYEVRRRIRNYAHIQAVVVAKRMATLAKENFLEFQNRCETME